MAWTFQLENATTTVNLNDGTNYAIMPNGFDAPTPNPRTVFAGDRNMFRSGSRLIRQAYDNREVTIRLKILGSDTNVLATNVETVESMLRRAQEFSAFAAGSQVKLKYQWDSATNPVYFHVVTGFLSPIGAEQHSTFLTLNTTLMDAVLTLVCEPFAKGAQETLENYVRDPSFEVAGTALADWTESKTATGTTARSTAQAKYGDASLLLTMTNSGGSGQVIERNQTLADVDAGETWSFSAWVYLSALSNSKAGLVLLYNDGSATTVTSYQTSTNTGFEKLSIANQTPPSGATQVIVKLRLEATASSATGTAYFDAVTATPYSSLPNTFVSSREVMNHFDDASQLHTNYVDINGIAGNQPGLLQVKAAENEAHTKFWMGARQGSRQTDGGLWHEAEDFVNTDWLADNSDAAASAGNETRITRTPAHVASAAQTSAGSTSFSTGNIAVSGVRRVLVAWLATYQSGGGGIAHTSVTFNSDESLTKVATEQQGNYDLSIWVLKDPSVATAAVACVTAAYTHAVLAVSAYQFVATTETTYYANSTEAKSAGTTGLLSGNVAATALGDLLVTGVAHGNNNASTASNCTERNDQVAGASGALSMATGDQIMSTTPQSSGFTWTGSVAAINQALVLKAGGDQASIPIVITKAVSNPPRGMYRVLVRADGQGAVWSVGIGYGYGTTTADPSTARDYPSATGTSAGYEILDAGTVTIPPVTTPENMQTGSFTLRLAIYNSTAAASKTLDLDWVMLVPIDFGSMYVSKASGTNVVLVDSISDLRTAMLIDTSEVVQSVPASQGGDPPTVHPDGTRLYFASDNGAADIDDGFTVICTVEPRFLSVAGT